MNNRLQFRHHNSIFSDKETAIDYIKSKVSEGLAENNKSYRYSLFAEPTVLRYGDETNPHVILAIGASTNTSEHDADNKYCIIDIDSTNADLQELRDILNTESKKLTVKPKDTDTLHLYAEKSDEGTIISGDVQVSESHVFNGETKENIIKVFENEGLFTYVDLKYEDDVLTFTVNDNVRNFDLKNHDIISGEYIIVDESLHLTKNNGDEIVIPLKDLIDEWAVEGESSATPIVLTKESVISGGTEHEHIKSWQDILRADVRLHENGTSKDDHNIIEKADEGTTLYVRGEADNIVYNDNGNWVTVQDTIKESKNNENRLEKKIDDEITRSTNEDNNLQGQVSDIEMKLDNEIKRSTDEDESLQDQINNIDSDVKSRLSKITSDNSINVDNTIPTEPNISVKLSQEVEDGKVNIIKLNNDGLYAGVEMSYDEDHNVLTFKTTQGTKQFALRSISLITKVEYVEETETIRITYVVDGKEQTVDIPMKLIIEEWDVSNDTTHGIELTKTRNAENNKDILSAVVKRQDNPHNMLEVTSTGLYVSDEQVKANEQSISGLQDNMTTAKADINTLKESLQNETTERIANDNELSQDISNLRTDLNAEVTRSTNADNEAKTKITEIEGNITSIEANLQDEINRATDAENTLQTNINSEAAKRFADDKALQVNIDNEAAKRYSEDEKIRGEYTKAVHDEQDRAMSAEGVLSQKIIDETNIRTSEDEKLKNEITALNSNVNTAKADINTLKESLQNETTERIANDNELNSLITKEIQDRKDKDNNLHNEITSASDTLTSLIDGEKTRAKGEEKTIKDSIGSGFDITNTVRDEINAVKANADGRISDVTASDNTVVVESEGTVRKVKTNISNTPYANGINNMIQTKTDGLFMGVDLSYEYGAAVNKLIFKVNDATKEIPLEVNSIVENIVFNPENNHIVIQYRVNGELKETEISIDGLIEEWDIKNTNDSAIELVKAKNEDPDGKYILSAKVLVSTAADNMLEMVDNHLVVSNKPVVKNTNDIAKLTQDLQAETARAEGAETTLDSKINTNTSSITSLDSKIDKEISDRENAINDAYTVLRPLSLNGSSTIKVERVGKSGVTPDEVTYSTKIATVNDNIIVIGGNGATEGIYSTVRLDYNPTDHVLTLYGPGNKVLSDNIKLSPSSLIDNVACVKGEIKAAEKAILGNEYLKDDCGATLVYTPNSSSNYIKDATSIADANSKLDIQLKDTTDAVTRLSGTVETLKTDTSKLLDGADTASVSLSVKDEKLNADVRLSHGKGAAQSDAELTITNSGDKDFTNTNVLRIVNLDGDAPNTALNGLYLSNVWDCGEYVGDDDVNSMNYFDRLYSNDNR